MRFFAALVVGLIFASNFANAENRAKEIVICKAKNHHDVEITINSMHKLGRLLSCVSGFDGMFSADMTTCAPNGAYALSAPTGSASITSIVDRWQDYGDHMGGIMYFGESPTSFDFEGGHFFDHTWQNMWSFRVSRISGKGLLRVGNKIKTTYDCDKKATKF